MSLDEGVAKFVVLLRGVNVGGVKVLKKDLARLMESGGYSQIRTLLASGNVILDAASKDAQTVQEHCDALLAEAYGRSIPTLVYPREEVLELAKAFPLEVPEPVSEHHRYVTFCRSLVDAQAVATRASETETVGTVAVNGRTACWIGRKGQSTTDPMSALLASEAKHRVVTTRNQNTVERLAEIIR